MSSQSSRPPPGGVALCRVKYMTGSRHRACCLFIMACPYVSGTYISRVADENTTATIVSSVGRLHS